MHPFQRQLDPIPSSTEVPIATERYRNIIRVPPGTNQRFLLLEQEASRPMISLGVRMSGIGTFGREYQVGYREPTSHLLLLTLEGSGAYQSDAALFRPVSGELLLSPLGVSMMLGTTDVPWTFVWFYIRGLKRWQHLDRRQPQLIKLPFAAHLHHAVEGLLAETGWSLSQSVLTEAGWMPSPEQTIVASNRAAILYGELVAEYLERILLPPSIAADPWQEPMHAMWKAIEQNARRPWSQLDMCKWLGMSPAMLQRVTRRLFHSSPRQMLIRVRMGQAKRMLQQTDYPLPLIAREVGYSDGFVFSSAFKRIYGVSPTVFRRSSRPDETDLVS